MDYDHFLRPFVRGERIPPPSTNLKKQHQEEEVPGVEGEELEKE